MYVLVRAPFHQDIEYAIILKICSVRIFTKHVHVLHAQNNVHCVSWKAGVRVSGILVMPLRTKFKATHIILICEVYKYYVIL